MNRQIINEAVAQTLAEDVGAGDITALLIDEDAFAEASVITRMPAVICGVEWFNAVYHELDPAIKITWQITEGDYVMPNQQLVTLQGNARSILTGERCALNWLQTLSATATITAEFVKQLQGTQTKLLDTRKTIPGLRYAQKYAVTVGGGVNHRMGLYDVFLIKENHIKSCGSISKAIARARKLYPNKKCEIEVENLAEFAEAIQAKPDIIMLDNFDIEAIKQAVAMPRGDIKLELSGNVDLANIKQYAQTNVDFISVGAITKNIQAIDLSMRII